MGENRPRKVALIHGLGRGRGSMMVLGHRLERAGFAAIIPAYPSRHVAVAEAEETVTRQLDIEAPEGCDLVGYSLGGVLALRMKLKRPGHFGRVVQIGPPNRGSPMAAFAGGLPVVPQVMGPVLAQLAAGEMGLDDLPAAVAGDLGIIAGAPAAVARLSPFWGIEGPSDSMVPVASALGVAHAEAVVTETLHAIMPLSAEVAAHTLAFLRDGRFTQGAAA